jgi:hypothetical protein
MSIKELVTIGDLETIKKLVKNKIYISKWATAIAAKNGHLHLIKYFIENSIEVDKHAIEYAIINNHYEIITYIFEKLIQENSRIIMVSWWIPLATRYYLKNKDERILRYLLLKGGQIPEDLSIKYINIIKKVRTKLIDDFIKVIQDIGFNFDISYLIAHTLF